MDRKTIVSTVFPVAIMFLLFSGFALAGSTEPSVNAVGSNEDWPMLLHDSSHTGYSSISGPATPAVLWTFNDTGNVASSPAVVDGSVYVASLYGDVYRLDAATGKQVWLNFKIPANIQSSPAVVDGKVYIGADDGRVYCLDAQTGNQMWNYTTGGWTRSSPTVVNGYVYIGSSDGNLYCLDTSSGIKIWSCTTGPLGPNADTTTVFTSGTSSPAVIDGYVFVGGPSLYCLNASSGSPLWSYPISVSSAPAVWGGYVYVTADDGNAYGFDTATGSKVWNYTVQPRNFGSPSPAVANGFVYIGADGVSCLNASTGEKVWSTMKGLVDPYPFSSPVIAGNKIYVWTTADDYLYCLDGDSGSVIWRGEFQGYNAGGNPPAIANGVLYVAKYNVVAYGSFPASSSPVTSAFPMSTVWILAVAGIVGAATIVAALLIYMNKRRQLPPLGSPQLGKLKKRFSIATTLVLIAVIAVTSVAILYETGFPTPQVTSPSPQPSPTPSPSTTPNSLSPLWQNNIGHQVTDVAVDDGKVFAVDNFGNVFAFDAQSGESLWNATVGSYGFPTIEVYEGNVYVSGAPSVVAKLNETDGRLETVFSAPYDYSDGSRFIARFSFINGRIVVMGHSGYAVYNASSGDLFWEDSQSPEEGYIHLGNTSATAAETDSVLVRYNEAYDLNNGSALWRINGSFSEPALVSEGKVILWNYDANGTYGSDDGHTVSCMNASSGAAFWSFNVGASAFQPTIYNDSLLFGASDGNLYAVNFTDGKLIWSTHVDTEDLMAGKNLPADSKYYSTPAVSPVLINPQTGTLIWAFAVTQSGVNGVEGNDLYIGVLSGLNLSSGHTNWNNQVVRNGSLSSQPPKTPVLGLASAGNTLYLASGTDLWTFNASTGIAQGMQHFDYGGASIVTGESGVFVIEDVYLIAYS